MDPYPNAYAMGDTRTMVTVTSGLLEYLTDEEVSSVIAHECGHIACRHMLYHTLASTLLRNIERMGILGNAVMPVYWALQYWSRRSELSADRAGAVALGSISGRSTASASRWSAGDYSKCECRRVCKTSRLL